MSASPKPTTAIVLAAGLGTRMRPLTLTLPKPLVRVAGRALIDHALDRLRDAGVSKVVVNVHYLADAIERHLADRRETHPEPQVILSDERGQLLETGGGVLKALPYLAASPRFETPFLVLNSDSLWIEGPVRNLDRMASAWQSESMDALLLVADVETSTGYDGRGDFTLDKNNRLHRRGKQSTAPFIYTGVALLKPSLFEGLAEEAFSLNRIFDIAGNRNRLFGLPLDGEWLHVGTPEAISMAEARMTLEQHKNCLCERK